MALILYFYSNAERCWEPERGEGELLPWVNIPNLALSQQEDLWPCPVQSSLCTYNHNDDA